MSAVVHKVVADPAVAAREVWSFERFGVDLAHGLPRLAGRTALITGAKSVIGLATAKALAAGGARSDGMSQLDEGGGSGCRGTAESSLTMPETEKGHS